MNNAFAKLAVQLTLDGGAQFLNVARAGVGALGSIGGAAVKLNQGLFYLIGNISSVRNALMAMGENVGNFLKPNIDMETAVLQFETILGSAEAARTKIAELSKFAQTTPFAMPEILKASRTLQTFGGNTLNTDKTLRLVGDAAAATGAQFDEVAHWAGRMYSSIQSGQPFAEAINRFIELGVITSDTAMALRKASDSGNFNGAWDIFISGLGRTSGAMLKLGDSWTGVTSTLGDQWDTIKRKVGEGLFTAMKEDITGLRDDIDKAFATGQIDAFSAKAGLALRGLYGELKEGLMGGLTVDDIMNAAEQGKLGAVLKLQLGSAAGYFWDKFSELGAATLKNTLGEDWGALLGNMMGANNKDAFGMIRREGASPEAIGNLSTWQQVKVTADWIGQNANALVARGDKFWDFKSMGETATDYAFRQDGPGMPSAGSTLIETIRHQAEANNLANEAKRIQEQNLKTQQDIGRELAYQFAQLRSAPAQM